MSRLAAGLLLGRLATTTMHVALILYVLQRFHSPLLAGITAFLTIFPGLVVSPFAGALLDRRGRTRLVVVDYTFGALALLAMAGLSRFSALPAPLLLVVVGFASLTNPLSLAGARTLFPVLAPPALWERANAIDSITQVFASLVGPPLAGLMVGLAGGEWALVVAACIFGAAALVMLGLADPPMPSYERRSIVADAFGALRYVVSNPSLRGLAWTLALLNIGFGILNIALPVLVLVHLHQGPQAVGLMFGVQGLGGIVSSLVAGRFRTKGYERHMMFFGTLASVAGMVVLPFVNDLYVLFAVVLLFGLATGPYDIALFTLRQRRTDPAWFGRAFAVSASINYSGSPIGSAIAGPLIGLSMNVALGVAVVVSLISSAFPMLAIPSDERVESKVPA
jgi:MFS family permease